MSSVAQPVYFELGWSILSTIGIANVLFGLLVAGITSLSPVSLVPIITSAAGAVANGLCYYAYYDPSYSLKSKAVAAAFGDILWMIQEAGLSFYSYVILSRVLRGRTWYIFAGFFWSLMLGIAAIRIVIAITRVRALLEVDGHNLQAMINGLHIGYFVLIAAVECLSAGFLLKIFAGAKSDSARAAATQTGFFKYLMRSTEVRLALLAVLGVMRAITYSFQTQAQSATDIASQLDRFAYTLECLFPVILFIDILASKVVFTNHIYYEGSSRSRQPSKATPGHHTASRNGNIMLTQTHGENFVNIHGGPGANGTKRTRTDSQERIIDNGTSRSPTSEIDLEVMDPKRPGISKTVEFEVYESDRRIV
ncbi:hypothetical protein F5X68DRAFT_50208 [Plectosphaerella plurivora]|uniref:Uncharacterized protein n=1 Tax=Plectosphaerella plurivora TaxID=936078 RepID=A0A9P8V4K1_9PEZI|nr:hypothetical protein F5X68DRAFT_50208 [Plectosphaerella plurivora]